MSKPRLSELPDFLPLGKSGSPERRACALGTFTNAGANAEFMLYLARCLGEQRLAAQHTQHPTASGAAVPEKALANAR